MPSNLQEKLIHQVIWPGDYDNFVAVWLFIKGIASFTSQNTYFLLLYLSFLGERTFGVMTKLDLMDKGTNALDVRIQL